MCRSICVIDGTSVWLYQWKLECECEDGSIEKCSFILREPSISPESQGDLWIVAVNEAIEQLSKEQKRLKRLIKITYSLVKSGYE